MAERLDRLIGRIRELQRPHMHGGGLGDILVVCPFIHQLYLRSSFDELLTNTTTLGRSWPYPSGFHQKVAEVFDGLSFCYDDGARRDWHFELCS